MFVTARCAFLGRLRHEQHHVEALSVTCLLLLVCAFVGRLRHEQHHVEALSVTCLLLLVVRLLAGFVMSSTTWKL